MEGVSDFATRLWFSRVSRPAFSATPFLRVTPSFPARRVSPLFAPESNALRGGTPWRLRRQLMASDPEDFARIAEALLQDDEDPIELNCGCPSPTVVGNGAGSSLLRSVDAFGTFVRRASQVIGPQNLAIKMRTGFEDTRAFTGLLDQLAELPLARLTVHGRTRAQRYTGQADWSLIGAAAKRMKLPVIGSGDVHNAASAAHKITEAPQLSGFVVGRGALRNPWIFSELRGEQPICFSPTTLTNVLRTFCVLQENQAASPERLVDVARALIERADPKTDEQLWKDDLNWLQTQSTDSTEIVDHRAKPKAFARTKMLWHYLRSSLPLPLRTPLLLRSKDIDEFTAHIQKICADHAITNLTPTWHPECDVLYSGQGNSNTLPNTLLN